MSETNYSILRFFEYQHLPPHLRDVSRTFYLLAHVIVIQLPPNEEKDMTLRKLLEAKDCAVRAMLP